MSPGRRVVVVGAGVSGCACAAELAERGLEVILVNSSLDSVGLPGYGPEVVPPAALIGSEGWQRLVEGFDSLPSSAGGAWLSHALVSTGPGALMAVDRRVVSVNTKWALERLGTLRIRQGLVTGVRRPTGVGNSGVEVETVFGEVLLGDACVLAVGMALGGRVRTGAHETGGGRSAEVPADALLSCLKVAGETLRPRAVGVGARFGSWRGLGSQDGCALPDQRTSDERRGQRGDTTGPVGPEADERLLSMFLRTRPRRELWELVELAPGHLSIGSETIWRDRTGRERARITSDDMERYWRERLAKSVREAMAAMEAAEVEAVCKPPSPYRDAGRLLGGHTRRMAATRLCGEEIDAVVVPDGVATGEWFASSGLAVPQADDTGLDEACESAAPGAAWAVSRPEHVITSWVLDREDLGGPLTGVEDAWACGQAAGCRSYLESLESGVRVGRLVAERLCR